MTYVFTKKQKNVALLCALALGVVSGVARAETNPAETGYLTDQRGTVARSGFGLCWHTGFGPAVPTPECDGTPTPTPTPLAAVAEPTPAVVATKPVMEKVTLDADALFDFDKAVLRPAGRATLDDFVGKLKGINLEVITAVGHADRFGSEAYNQRLSEQRAAAVKTYLVSRGIESDRIQTEGKGEMQPITKSDECRGAKSTKVIACLQPDRRVNIEVIGSQSAK